MSLAFSAPADLHPSTQVSLDYGAKYAYVLESGEFSLSVLPSAVEGASPCGPWDDPPCSLADDHFSVSSPDVSSGFHTVQVLSGTHAFPEVWDASMLARGGPAPHIR